jgi:hypothetical protein
MTVNAARRSRRRTPDSRLERAAPTESLAIGEINQTVFDCPNCTRPLAIGVRRCPGCGTRLVLGIPLTKASVFVALGLAMGIAFGGAVSFALTLARAPATGAPAIAVLPSQPATAGDGGIAPTTSPTTVPSISSGPAAEIPPISRSALSQALSVNGRLAAGAAALRAALAAHEFDASTVAETLRSLSGDSVFGQQLAGRLAYWPDATTVGRNLDRLYDAVHQTATDWLVASIRDEAAYHAAAIAMLDVLNGLTAADAEASVLAGRFGLTAAPSAAP